MKVEGVCPNNACPTVVFTTGTHFRHVQLAPADKPLCTTCNQELIVTARVPDRHRFPLGNTIVTQKAAVFLMDHGKSSIGLLTRHAVGDWGSIDATTWQQNESSVIMRPPMRTRLLSRYRVGDDVVLIVTEGGRHETTVLMREEF